MLPCGKVNWEGKFVADGNHTPSYVSAGDGAQVSGIYEQKDGFEGNTSEIAFVCLVMQSCIEVAVEVLDDCWIVVATAENTTINL
jgi:hypothetical protein